MAEMTRALVYEDGEIMSLAKDEWPFPADAKFICENGHEGSCLALCTICGSNAGLMKQEKR